jgi:hypothetical protein
LSGFVNVTEKMGIWWPLATHKIEKAKAVDAVIEPRVGGRWYERGDHGSTCDWGRVLSWEPHARLPFLEGGDGPAQGWVSLWQGSVPGVRNCRIDGTGV